MKETSRQETLRRLADALAGLSLPHPVRVGVDGFSCSGKTVLADELAELLRKEGKEVLRAGLDGFHNPPEIRHRKGPMSVEGYLEDSFDCQAVREKVLLPLGPGGSLLFLPETFDHEKGEEKNTGVRKAPADSILLFEGVMLFRKELVDFFDFRILVSCSEEVVLERAQARDLPKFGNLETLLEKYDKRFLPGQRRYLEERRPENLADVILRNDEPERPQLHVRFKEKG